MGKSNYIGIAGSIGLLISVFLPMANAPGDTIFFIETEDGVILLCVALACSIASIVNEKVAALIALYFGYSLYKGYEALQHVRIPTDLNPIGWIAAALSLALVVLAGIMSFLPRDSGDTEEHA
jgi:hypothetical protein